MAAPRRAFMECLGPRVRKLSGEWPQLRPRGGDHRADKEPKERTSASRQAPTGRQGLWWNCCHKSTAEIGAVDPNRGGWGAAAKDKRALRLAEIEF